jgi:hypothetical protein
VDEDVSGLGRPVARSSDHPLHALDKSVALAQFLELFRGQVQLGVLDENREMLGRDRFDHWHLLLRARD